MKVIRDGQNGWTVYGPDHNRVKIKKYKDRLPISRLEKTRYKITRNGKIVTDGIVTAEEALTKATDILKRVSA